MPELQEAWIPKLFRMDPKANRPQRNTWSCLSELESHEQEWAKLPFYRFPLREPRGRWSIKKRQLNWDFKWTDVRCLQQKLYGNILQWPRIERVPPEILKSSTKKFDRNLLGGTVMSHCHQSGKWLANTRPSDFKVRLTVTVRCQRLRCRDWRRQPLEADSLWEETYETVWLGRVDSAGSMIVMEKNEFI